jgi:hypothetical protein
MAVPLPDRATLEAVRQRAKDERAFWHEHRAALTRQYPDEFVAVRAGEILDHDPDLMVLTRRLQRFGIRPSTVSMELMATAPEYHLM